MSKLVRYVHPCTAVDEEETLYSMLNDFTIHCTASISERLSDAYLVLS